MNNITALASPPSDDDVPLLRELLSYDMQCESCAPLMRGEHGGLMLNLMPSPLHWSRQSEWPWVIRNAGLEPHHDVLDVGGGWSVLQYALAKRSRSVTVLDVDAAAFGDSERTAATLGIGNIRRFIGDGRSLPFPDASFDRVVCVSVLEHVDGGRDAMLHEMIRVLKPGGCLLLTMDFVWEGETVGNFHVRYEELVEMANGLGLPPAAPLGDGPALAVAIDGGAKIAAVMARWVKPVKESE